MTDSDRIVCVSCGVPIAVATRFCAACGAEQPGRECPGCHERVLISARFCGACGCPTALEEAWVELTSAYDLVVDRFVDDSGVEREQQVRPRTVSDADGVRQVPEPTRILLTAGIERAIKEGRLVRVAPPPSSAGSSTAPSEPAPSSMTGDWRSQLVAAFGLGGGASIRDLQHATHPGGAFTVTAINEAARVSHDPRTSLPYDPDLNGRRW